jgi:hypothetical protein
MADIVLTINTNYGKSCKIKVKTTYTVKMVKCVLYGKWDIPPERQTLRIGRDKLFNSATLDECGIYADTSVDVLFLVEE